MYFKEKREKITPIALTILRLVVGLIMVVHGWQKFENIEGFQNVLVNLGIPFPALNAYLAIAGELLGGLGLMVGLLTPIASFGIVATMSVAVFHVHWANGLLAKNNGFEFPLVLLCAGLFFMFNGAGCISIDGLLEKKCNKS